jgi:hypothetical protein
MGMAQYIDFSLLIGNPHMGNTQYGNGHVTIFSHPTSHQKSTSIIDLSPS